ncbi:MAG: DUF4845 domain-containing protein [Candidatus Nitrotoga sp.]
MMKAMIKKQRGVTLSGLLIWCVILIFLAIGGMKVVPAYVEAQTIKGILKTVGKDPDMQDAALKDIREAYAKRAMMNNITVIDARDIEINKSGGGLKLSVYYSKKIELVGNASLLLEFDLSNL